MFETIIGQNKVKNQLIRAVQAAKIGQTLLPHFLLSSGTGGTGKTMFIQAVSEEIGYPLIPMNANVCEPAHIIGSMINSRCVRPLIFLEEWNSKNEKLDFFLRPYMENGLLMADGITYSTNYLGTIAIATNNVSVLSQPLISRLRIYQMDDYTHDEMLLITRQHSDKLGLTLSDEVIDSIASRSRSIPREVVKVLKVLAEHTLVSMRPPTIDETVTIMEEMGIYKDGFNTLDLKMMRMLANAKELSLSAICGATGESMETIRQHEAFLIKNGMLTIKTRRMLTKEGYDYITNLS